MRAARQPVDKRAQDAARPSAALLRAHEERGLRELLEHRARDETGDVVLDVPERVRERGQLAEAGVGRDPAPVDEVVEHVKRGVLEELVRDARQFALHGGKGEELAAHPAARFDDERQEGAEKSWRVYFAVFFYGVSPFQLGQHGPARERRAI